MAYLFVYCVVWVLCCFVTAIVWEDYDPKQGIQTWLIVSCCSVWPLFLIGFITQELGERFNND